MINFASIDFAQNSIISKDFDDTYFSKNSAIEEKEYVFLKQNNIPQIFKNGQNVVVGEIGFGLGINFLLTFRAFVNSKSSAKLQFYSIDKFPLRYVDLKKIYENFDELKPFADKFLQRYKELKKGENRFVFDEENIELVLFIDEANEALKSFCEVDIWFIDGFAPSKNSEIYTDEIFETIKQKSKVGTTFSTYSCAGVIKRGMQNAGFEVEKAKGFGEKKHMLRGIRKTNKFCI